MSMILDALKRADRERRQQNLEVPTLDTSHAGRPQPARNRRRWLIGFGFVLPGLLVTIGLLWFRAPWQPAPGANNTRTEGAVSGSESEDFKADRARVRRKPEPTPKAAIEALYQDGAQAGPELGRKLSADQIASLYRQALDEAPEPTPGLKNSQATNTLENRKQPETAGAADTDRIQPPSDPAPVSTRPQNDMASGAASPESPDPVQEPALSGLPQIHTLPPSVRRQIPSINYQEHHYLSEGGSWVRLNRERMRAGDRINADLRIESIDEEGMTLNYRGRSFRLRALNSWINM